MVKLYHFTQTLEHDHRIVGVALGHKAKEEEEYIVWPIPIADSDFLSHPASEQSCNGN